MTDPAHIGEDIVTGVGKEPHPIASPLSSWHDFSSIRVWCAGLGEAAALGSLSVPSSWPRSSARTGPTPPAIGDSDSGDAPTGPASRAPALTYQQALMEMMTGHRSNTEGDKHVENESKQN